MGKRIFRTALAALFCAALLAAGTVRADASALSDDTIRNLLEVAVGDSYEDCDTEFVVMDGDVVFKINPGITRELMELSRDNAEVKDAWQGLTANLTEVSEAGLDVLNSLGIENGTFAVLVTDDVASAGAGIYLCIINGNVYQDYFG